MTPSPAGLPHPLTVMADAGHSPHPTWLLSLLPDTAVAASRSSPLDQMRPQFLKSCLARRDLTMSDRQRLADALASAIRLADPHLGPMLLLDATNVIHRGWVPDPSVLWPAIQQLFSERQEGVLNVMATPSDPSYRGDDLLGTMGAALLAERFNLPLEPESASATLRAAWPRIQQGWRDEGQRATLPSHWGPSGGPGHLTFATPWDVSARTAFAAALDDQSPWLLPREQRTPRPNSLLSGPGALTSWRQNVETLEEMWPTLAEQLARGTWPLHGHLVSVDPPLPPMTARTFDVLLDGLETSRRARDLAPLITLAWETIRSEPTRDLPRVARALLSATRRFPSLNVNPKGLLLLLPLTPGTHDLWWELASTVLLKAAGHQAAAADELRTTLMAHRVAGGGNISPLDEPSAAILEHYRDVYTPHTSFLLAPTHFAATRYGALPTRFAPGPERPPRSR